MLNPVSAGNECFAFFFHHFLPKSFCPLQTIQARLNCRGKLHGKVLDFVDFFQELRYTYTFIRVIDSLAEISCLCHSSERQQT